MTKLSNIFIVGAQSTGKTTLVDALADNFHVHPEKVDTEPQVIKEVARGVLQRHNFTAQDIVASKSRALELQKLIIEAQAAAEEAAGLAWYISDRSGIDPLVYTRRYVGLSESKVLQQEPSWQSLEKRMRSGLVIVCEAGGAWLVDDGVRLMPEDCQAWIQTHETFCEILNELDIKHAVLPASLQELNARVDFVVSRWERR